MQQYMNIEFMRTHLKELDEEILRSKEMINTAYGQNNGTAFNQIVRRYCKELKEYRKIVMDDLDYLVDLQPKRFSVTCNDSIRYFPDLVAVEEYTQKELPFGAIFIVFDEVEKELINDFIPF